MNCRLCEVNFSQSTPRVLINCGHTLCENCIHNSLSKGQIKCVQCGALSAGSSLQQYPVNATLISLLNQEGVCRVHNQKLDAYCEKDNQLLCLSCVISGQHKSHKITPVAEKVAKDRAILKQCSKTIACGIGQISVWKGECEQEIERLQHQYKDYLLEMGLCFKTLTSTINELEESFLKKGKAEFEKYVGRFRQTLEELSQRQKFMGELIGIYEQVMALPNLQYLSEDNKRLFIMENCKFKKSKVDSPKLQLNKTIIYSEALTTIQQLITFEKKLMGQSTPGLKHKKSNRSKEPTILQVNLNEQYKKHYKGNSEKTKINKQKSIIAIKTPKQIKEKSNSQKEPVALSIQNSDQLSHSFQTDAFLPPSMVNSFMDSEDRTLSIRGSEADFTLCSFDAHLYHFGSFSDSSVEFGKVGGQNWGIKEVGLNRSKANCAVLPSYSPFICLIFGGKSSSDDKLDSFVEFDLQTHKCRISKLKLSEPKSGFGCAVKDGRLFIIGGSNNQKSLKSFEEYRTSGMGLCKTDLPSMSQCRDELGVVLGYDGFIYACGGINQSGSVLASCERYNWAKSRWQSIPSMNKARRCFAIVSLPHGIYAIGGYDGTQYLGDVQLFDFTSEKWVMMPSLLKARFAHTAVVSCDLQSIEVCGGFNKGPLKCVQRFNIGERRWSLGRDMEVERFLHCSLVVNF